MKIGSADSNRRDFHADFSGRHTGIERTLDDLDAPLPQQLGYTH